MTVKLSAIRDAGPCEEGWKKLVNSLGGIAELELETSIEVSHIMSSNNLSDTLWVLVNACGMKGKQLAQLFACDVAERGLYIYEAMYPNDLRPRKAIEVVRAFLKGTTTGKQLLVAAAAADASAAASAAADAAADAAYAAASAASAAAADASASAAAAYVAAAAASAADAADAAAAEKAWQESHLLKLLAAQ